MQPTGGRHWSILPLTVIGFSTLVQVVTVMIGNSMVVIAPAMATLLQIDPALIGFQVSFVYGGAMVAVIYGGRLAQRYGAWQMLVLFFVSSAAGAALFAAFPSGGALVGASGGIAGLTGAACRFIFQPMIIHRDPVTGEQRMLGRKLASFGELIRDRRAGVFILVWLGGNAVVPLLPELFGGSGSISWQAHLGGFLAGLLLVPLFERKPKEPADEH